MQRRSFLVGAAALAASPVIPVPAGRAVGFNPVLAMGYGPADPALEILAEYTIYPGPADLYRAMVYLGYDEYAGAPVFGTSIRTEDGVEDQFLVFGEPSA